MDINEEIKMSKLMIELYHQYCKEVQAENRIVKSTETLAELNKLKNAFPTIWNKVLWLGLN